MNILNFSNCSVLNEDGKEIRLGSLWKNQTILFIFLRHFACIACRAHATQIWLDRDKYQKNGTQIIFVGNGHPSYIKFFKEDLRIKDALVFTDPTLQSFQAAGFNRGFRAVVNAQTAVNSIKLIAQGHKQIRSTEATGDLWQLGGIIVIHPNSKVAYQYVSEALGDFPPEKDLIEPSKDL